MSPKGLLQKVIWYEKGQTSVSRSEILGAPAPAQQSTFQLVPSQENYRQDKILWGLWQLQPQLQVLSEPHLVCR